MSGWDAAAFDRWLTTPPEDRASGRGRVDVQEPAEWDEVECEPYHRSPGECIHCGGEGCCHCEPDEDYHDEEAELLAKERTYEHDEIGL